MTGVIEKSFFYFPVGEKKGSPPIFRVYSDSFRLCGLSDPPPCLCVEKRGFLDLILAGKVCLFAIRRLPGAHPEDDQPCQGYGRQAAEGIQPCASFPHHHLQRATVSTRFSPWAQAAATRRVYPPPTPLHSMCENVILRNDPTRVLHISR